MAKLTFGPGDDLRRRRQIRDIHIYIYIHIFIYIYIHIFSAGVHVWL